MITWIRKKLEARQRKKIIKIAQSDLEPKNVWVRREHHGWGDSIQVLVWNEDRIRISGHTSPRPEEYDILIVQMTSGKRAVLRLINIRYCNDPKDMWFADGEPIDYFEEMNTELRKRLRIDVDPKTGEPKGTPKRDPLADFRALSARLLPTR